MRAIASITQRMRRYRWLLGGLAGLLLLLAFALIIGACFTSLPLELRTPQAEQSLRVEDRNGRLLREVRTADGARSKWVALSAMPAVLPKMLIAVEDRRFYFHPGVDPVSVLRAAVHDAWRLRVVSGASTLTMQLARAVRPHRRNLWGKCQEMALALRIEASLSKSRILEEYLNRVDFGPNLRGIGAAAQGYFGKPVASLSLSEMALLVGMPQGPSVYALHRHPARALARRRRVLERVAAAQLASTAAIAAASAEPLRFQHQQPVFGAPHLIAALLSSNSGILQTGLRGTEAKATSRLRTTLDPLLQRAAETALSATLPELAAHHVTSGAALVVDNESGDILAYVGSPSFFDAAHQGQVDGVRAKRQPGSTLKPFVYAAAIEELGYTPATVLPDLELHLRTPAGDYAPRNFDDKFHGPVRLREALGNSLNIPAVHVASELGAPTLLRRLHEFGFDSLTQPPDYYGPALALGDGEVTLLELVRAYATLARGGLVLPLHALLQWEEPSRSPTTARPEIRNYQPPEPQRALSPLAAALVTDMLADNRARVASFGLESSLHFDPPVAAKTGTSKGYRDNWVIGYSKRVTVGVWVGNFDGSPMREVSGITGAGPIFRAIMDAARAHYADSEPLVSIGVQDKQQAHGADGLRQLDVCPLSGQLRGPNCPQGIQEMIPANVTLPTCEWHRKWAIDRRNGLLAGPTCPASAVVEKLFETLPSEYAAWEKSQGRALPPEEYSPNCPAPEVTQAQTAESRLVITEPQNGARYVIDPERAAQLQQLSITVQAPAATREVLLEVDGAVIERASRPFEFQWTLRAGEHRLVAVDTDGHRSEPVLVVVRGAGE
jgi:penicillin-binding protein 1C